MTEVRPINPVQWLGHYLLRQADEAKGKHHHEHAVSNAHSEDIDFAAKISRSDTMKFKHVEAMDFAHHSLGTIPVEDDEEEEEDG